MYSCKIVAVQVLWRKVIVPCRKDHMSFRPKKAVALSEAEGDAKHREVEKSIQKQISRLARMDIYNVFYKAKC